MLWLPYVEPAFLLHHRSTAGLPIPSFAAESREEYLKLARRWEELGLLRLVEKPIFENAFVRVFNAFKDRSCDRQIGDRRIVNYAECHGPGPSSGLPQGQMLTALHVDKGGCIKGSITDRRDFYHQCAVTPERFATNLVPFSFPPEVFEGSAALEEFKQRSFQRMGGRELEGDKLGESKPRRKKEMPEALFPSFGALYQGDHLGVEFGLGGHEGLLTSEGLLRPENRLLGGCLPPRSQVWEALIIDDFFVISTQTEDAKNTEAFKRLERARDAYKRHGLEGSPEKDVVAEVLFKAAGAEIDSRSEVLSRSLALVGAPLGKRVGLASLSLRIATLGFITPTLASRMAGGWTSVLLYRRCIASIVNKLFQLGTYSESWRWKRRAHINVYEASTVTSLLNQLIKDEPSTRHNLVVDSRVAQGSLVKGRSSALSLQPVLQKAAACQLAGDIYPAISFGPTRIIPADAPSRDREIEQPVPHSILSSIATTTVPKLHDCRLPRPYANWVRLSLLVCFSNIPASAASPSYPSASSSGFALSWTVLLCLLIVCGVFGSVKGCFSLGPLARICWILLLSCRHVGAPMVPMSAAEESRAQFRSGLALASDRLIRPQTRVNRQQLLSAFQDWIFAEHGLQWQQIISAVPLDLELLNRLLVGYGKEMHASGKAYGKYAETINAVATAKPLVKRHLTMAWDLAFAWLQDEPADHHPAMPVSVLLAAMTVGIMWGWPVVSALLGLTWAGLLRIGEVLAAKRADLVLPFEAPPGTKHILLRIQNPKTRGRVARHQAARVDPADIVALVQAVFKDYGPDQPLWSMSAYTLRKRFVAILNFFGLPVKKTPAARPYDLASLRPGGATFLLGLTEDAELVRRRGRWISQRVLEIYLQEIAVSTAVAKLPEATRQKIGRFAGVFGEVLSIALEYLAAHVPEQSWHILFQHHQRPGSQGKYGF